MNADGKGLPKWARVAAAVRGQIADGTLRPGQPAPSGGGYLRGAEENQIPQSKSPFPVKSFLRFRFY